MVLRAETRLRRLVRHLRASPAAGPGDELVPPPSSFHLTDEDMAALKRKYNAERDKRMNAHPEGNDQYSSLRKLAETDIRFARMLEDPYPKIERSHPLTDSVEVCIIGAGYGGLCVGARLVMEGVSPKDIRLLDKAGDVGGTWYWNRYPGAACDVESYVYMPLCEEMGYIPTQKYANQPELFAHSQLIAKTYGLYENACFGSQVTHVEWVEATGMWSISTNRGDCFSARFVSMNFGTLANPKLPGVPGVESFKGHMFHTSRWDYDYTGGSSIGGLGKLHNKRVAVIGTGATAVQVVPHLAEAAEHLYVFQRTPSSVDIRNNCPTTEEFAREHLSKPGWQRERQQNFHDMVQTFKGAKVDLVNDGWTDIVRNLMLETARIWASRRDEIMKGGEGAAKAIAEIKRATHLTQYQQMEKVRRRVDIVVKDKAAAEALKPWYDQFCKRPCFHDAYLTSFNRPSVTLVDTSFAGGIERITAGGIVANGVEHEVDCIVMATGFESNITFPYSMESKGLGYDVVGRRGVTLSGKWGDTGHKYGAGPKTYRSYHCSGFPNFFMQNAPQGAFTINFVEQLDEGARHFAHLVGQMRKGGHRKFDVKPEVEDQYLAEMWKRSPVSTGKRPNCTPGYYNQEGRILPKGTRQLGGDFPGGPRALFATCAKERQEGRALDAFDLE